MPKNFSYFLVLVLACIIISCQQHQTPVQDQKIKREKRLNGRMTDFMASLEYEHNLLKDPKTGKIPEGIREQELKQAKEIYKRQSKTASANYYIFQGPENIGGRTRTVIYDVRYNGTSNQTLLAGGVSGGVYKSTDNGNSWIRKSPVGEHFSCTSIAQDPRPGFQNTWYYTTGEAMGNSAGANGAFYSGNGAYKSIDNGETWLRLTNSNTSPLESFSTAADLISKVVVSPINGDVYIACLGSVLRSQNGGSTWSPVLSTSLTSSLQMTEIIVTSTGRYYAAFAGYNDISVDGVWTSESGNVSSWTRIAGTGSLTNPEAWPAQGGYGRVVLAVAPSNENILYALYYNNQSYPNLEADFFKYDRLLNTWEDRSDNLPDETGGSAGNDPFAVQGGYDLVVAVKPDNENVVFIGGTNIYRSNDGFASKTNTTRIGGYATASAYNMYPNSHPDIHAIVFDPLSPSIMICGNDGGMQKTFDCMASSVLWTPINTGFRTFQYYYVTVDPRTGNNKVMGGAQDNGTTRNIGGSGTNMEMILGGDGVAVGLSNTISGQNYEYVGWQFGQIIRRNATAPDGSGTVIRPSTATSNGLFVTLFHLDPDNSNTLYYANTNLLFRNVSASTATTLNWTNMSGIATTVTTSFNITALAATRGTYNATKSNLFFGTSNGRVFRLDDPGNAAAASIPVNISGSFPASGYVSSISVNPRNDDTVLVSFSNYNVTSIWWTGNANAASPTWQNVEGNLTIPSVRSSAIALTSDGIEYFVGTSVGLYKAATINGSNAAATSWTQEGVSEVGNAVITSLSLRPSDNKLLVGTHGYGMWATSLSLTTLPVNLLEFNGNIKNENVFLEWKATHDSDEGGFEIEKSEDGTSFRKIGFIKLRSANGPSAYSFVDGEAASEKNYYRLRMFELNSTAKYSHVLVFRNDNSQQVFVNNPFVHQLEIRFAKLPKKLRIQISDASGRIVMQRQYNNLSSPRLVIQDLNGIGKGMYFMQTDADGKMFTSKIIRQ